MSSFYYYFISSLPMLHFGLKPPFSWEQFIARAKEMIPESDAAVLQGCAAGIEVVDSQHPLVKSWIAFEYKLRNELVKVRAVRQRIDPIKYLRPDGYAGSEITHIALAALRHTSPLEAEKYLDQERWQALEELAAGQFFNLEYLIIYAYKLMILLRWENIRTADGVQLLEQALAAD